MRAWTRKITYLGASVLAGVLWRLGGSDIAPKAVRRYGVAGLLSTLVFEKTASIPVALISLAASIIAYSLGYGESSALAALFTGLGITNHTLLDICIRSMVGCAYGLAGYMPTIVHFKRWDCLYSIALITLLVPAARLLGNRVGAVLEETIIGFLVVFLYLVLIPNRATEQ